MPRNYVRKTDRANIDETRIRSAMEECLSKRLSVSEAARQYGIKRTTLQSRIATSVKKNPIGRSLNDDSNNDSENPGENYSSKYTVKQVFTMNQELQLNDYIKKSSNLHYGLTYMQIRVLALQFAKSCPTCRIPDSWEQNKMAGLLN